ncbi:hypothetical protein [Hugenholtzia roseola]|uniref:hypothetical protein n=1 Tax=Hugenholtzia roseola TaxID=1002 RepID=UPI000425DE75|nr:hypothetical protein [Hugenholtzia roseola]
MAAHHDSHGHAFDREALVEQYEFSAKAKRIIFIILGIGLLFTVIGLFQIMSDSGHHAEHASALLSGNELASAADPAGGGAAHGGEHHSAYHWTTRLKANLWVNVVFFSGIALLAGVFFVAVQYVAAAGWSVGVLRVAQAFGWFLPVGGILMLGTFLWGSHELFHWTHDYLYDTNSPQFDAIIAGKQDFLNTPFFLGRMVLFFAVWILFFFMMQKHTFAQDIATSLDEIKRRHRILVKLSAGFIVFLGVSSSIAAWDWVMSIDTHWFSTMFGWYNFASWWVTALAAITLTVVMLREAGYLKFVNENHLHDLGKFVFAFSIFWTYIYFSQFLLIYYANIPEETIYFVERLSTHYSKYIFIILFLNFAFPFLFLMTRNAKRKHTTLKIACIAVIIGHWFDFYQMITPGTLKENGAFGFLELGLPFVFIGVFAYIVASQLSKKALVAKNHPMLEECVNHHI